MDVLSGNKNRVFNVMLFTNFNKVLNSQIFSK